MDKIKQKTTVSDITGLTPLQEDAAILLAAGTSITDVCKRLELNRTTLYQWQDKVTFKCFMNYQRMQMRDELKNGIYGLHKKAVKALEDCLSSDNDRIRLDAAATIIDKVTAYEIGETDARNELKKQATSCDLVPAGRWNTLDEEKYIRLLKENGLQPGRNSE